MIFAAFRLRIRENKYPRKLTPTTYILGEQKGLYHVKIMAEMSKMSKKKKLKCQHTLGNVCETQQGKVLKVINVKVDHKDHF